LASTFWSMPALPWPNWMKIRPWRPWRFWSNWHRCRLRKMPTVADLNEFPDPGRRQFVETGLRMATACVALPLTNLMGGCQKEPEPAAWPVVVAAELIPIGQRLRLENNGSPVELQHTADGIAARSLLCTHQGCKVRWHEDKQLYICPCHEGKFDAAGEVVYGMPRGPLRQLEVTVVDNQVIVSG